MRTLSNLANFSLILIMFSLIALGASMVAVPQMIGKINELIALNRELQAQLHSQNILIKDLRQKLADKETQFASQGQRVGLLETELQKAVAKNNELSMKIKMLELQITSMTLAQKAAPLLQILSVGVLLAANRIRIKKEPDPSIQVKAPQDENIVTIRMTREQARGYSKWRRNERK